MEVSISAILECALFHLSHASVGITLWVDALCINQSDDGEKSEAVQQMKAIYQDAIHVVVWLGPSDKDSDLALEVMDQLGKEACDIGFWDISPRSFLEAWLNDRDSGQNYQTAKVLARKDIR
jgi:Heterokaryon incompatibility protein (HET)